MPTFFADIRDSQGKIRKEKIIAQSLADARTNLRNQGFIVKDIKQSQSLASILDINKIQNSFIKVSVKDKAIFSDRKSVV